MQRSLNRSAVRSGKVKPVEARHGRPKEPSVCEKCGAVFMKRTWRRDHAVTRALLKTASWAVCPACDQVERQECWGRLTLRGRFGPGQESAIRKRIANVAARAASTQPERRLVSIERQRDGLEVRTTSQKLAHRIVSEIEKAFGGHTAYSWSDDRSLYATWELG